MNDVWDIVKWLSQFDIVPAVGWNWFSILCFFLMFLFAVNRCIEYYNPFSPKKLPAIFLTAISPLLLYYSFLDTTTGLLRAATAANLQDSFAYYYHYEIEGIFGYFFGARYFLIAITMVFCYLYSRYYFKFKTMGYFIVAHSGFMFLTILIFGTHNMRLLDEDLRAVFYLTSFIPMWSLWLGGFTQMWREVGD